MAQVDFAERQLTLKFVYYGPPLSGKTSNLRALHDNVDKLNRGRLMTLDTRDDRTLFFDLLPIFFRAGSTAFSFRIKVYTVPGQPVHEATRKVVLTGSDGVVFVADSHPDQRANNRAAWDNLVGNLATLGLQHIPIIVQYNKRDLPEATPLPDCDRFGEPNRVLTEASAKDGVGVVSTFFELASRAWMYLDTGLKLTERTGLDAVSFRKAIADHVGEQLAKE
ncbi:MAG: GTPase domain-containing protein [Proteobacteria bacterium]|nr:GTPase domain-containing protein [Pseudomonadota bacterium]